MTKVKEIFEYLTLLEKKGIVYLDGSGYSYIDKDGSQIDVENSTKYNEQYEVLFEGIFMQMLVNKLGLDFKNSDLTFNFFDNEDGTWKVNLWEPEVSIPVDDIFTFSKEELINKYSELSEYRKQEKEMSFEEMLNTLSKLKFTNYREFIKGIISLETDIEDDKLDEIYASWVHSDDPLISEKFYDYE